MTTGCAMAVDPTEDARTVYDGSTGVSDAPPGVSLPPDVYGIGNPPDARWSTGVDAGPSGDVGIATAPDEGRDGIAEPPDAGPPIDAVGGPHVPPEFPFEVFV